MARLEGAYEQVSQRLMNIDPRFDALDRKINLLHEAVDKKIDMIDAKKDQRFNALEQRIDSRSTNVSCGRSALSLRPG